MAWSSAALSATELALMDADKPLLVGSNRLRDIASSSIRWNTTGNASGASSAAADGPGYYVRDGFTHLRAKPNASNTDWFLTFDLGSEVEFDTIAVLQHNLLAAVDVAVEIADDNTFATNLVEIFEWPSVSSNRRLVATELKHTGDDARRYTARYVRLNFTSAGAITPAIGEVIIGSRRQLKHNPRLPWDPVGLRSIVDSHISSSGIETRYVQLSGQRRIDAQINPHETAYSDDVIEFYRDDLENGVLPFLWVDKPSSEPYRAAFCKLADPSLEFPYVGPYERNWRLVAYEQGPQFVAMEA